MNPVTAQQQRADRLARPMFFLSLLFLFLLGALIVIEVDIPRVTELAALEAGLDPAIVQQMAVAADDGSIELMALHQFDPAGIQLGAQEFGGYVLTALLLIWPIFLLEYLVTIWPAAVRQGYLPGGVGRFIACLIPPLRLAAPSPGRGYRVWLPGHGWRLPGRQLSRSLERTFSKPMLVIALLILPILVIEYGLRGLVEKHAWLQILLHVSTGMIWFAFTVEFIIMVNATDKKLRYVRKHWVDLAIILLPLISFLRSIRVLRIARVAKVQKLAKLGRIYRMRGLLMKLVRALMLFDAVQRLIGMNPQKKLEKLRLEYDEQLEDLEELRQEIRVLEEEIRQDS